MKLVTRHLFAVSLLLGPPALLLAAPPPLTNSEELFSRLDGNSDGRLEDNEIKPAGVKLFRKLLAAADKDRDGALTREEFVAGLKETRPERPLERLPDPPTPQEVARAVFRRLDGDRNGKLELKEVPPRQQPKYRQLLPTADKDGNGALDVKEFEAVSAALMAEPAAPAGIGQRPDSAAMLKQVMQLDANGDGKIDGQEARGPVKKRFERLDTDGNGVLDGQEVKRAAERFARAVAEPGPDGQMLKERLESLQKRLKEKP